MRKYFDIKPTPITSFERWQAWLNWTQARLITMAGKRIKINTMYFDPLHETKFWARHERMLEERTYGE